MGRAMVREDFEAAGKALYALANKAVTTGLEVAPFMFILRLDEEHRVTIVIPVDCGIFFEERMGTGGKKMAAMILERLSRTPETDIAALVTEAFVLEATEEELTEAPVEGSLESDPRHKECVVAFLRTPGFTTIASWALDRDNKKLVYEPVKWGGEGLTGRFSHRAKGQALN